MKRVFCVVGGAFLLGAGAASFLSLNKQAVLVTVCLFFCLMGWFLFHKHWRSSLAVGFCFLVLGGISFDLKTAYSYEPIAELDGQTAEVTALVLTAERRDNGRFTYELSPSQPDTAFHLLLYTDSSVVLKPGDTVSLCANLYLPDSTDLFDSARYYHGKQIGLMASPEKHAPIRVTRPNSPPLRCLPEVLRQKLAAQLDEVLNPEAAAIVKGMILGDREGLSYSLEQAYRDAGNIHLFSISGLHISILAGVLLLLFKKFPPLLRTLLILSILAVYIVIGGIQLSALRSGLMFAVLLSGDLFYRKSDACNSLFFAGFLIVLFDAYAIMDIGFCMSFLATLGLLTLSPFIERKLLLIAPVTRRWAQQAVLLVSISLGCLVGILPVSIWNLKTFSLIAPISSLAVSILEAPVVVLGFCCTLLSGLPVLRPFFAAEELLISLLNVETRFFGNLPFASIGLDYGIYRIAFLIAAALLLLGVLWRHKPLVLRWSITASLLLFLCCPIAVKISTAQTDSLYIVGDGSCSNIIFVSHGRATVISPADNDSIDRQTIRFLRGKGIRRLENLLIPYAEFSKYRDTLDLLSVYAPAHLLYRESNENLRFLTEQAGFDGALLPLQDKMEIKLNQVLTLTVTEEKREALRLNLDNDTAHFSIGRLSDAPQDAILLLTGQLDGKQPSVPLALALQAQYTDLPDSVPPAYRQVLEFRITPGKPLTLVTSK